MFRERMNKNLVLPLLMAITMMSTFFVPICAQPSSGGYAQTQEPSVASQTNGSGLVDIAESKESEGGTPIWSVILYVGVVLLLVILGFIGFICLPILPLFQSKVDKDILIEHMGEAQGTNGKRVLIAYYSRHGTSSSIAKRIYDILTEKGMGADLRFIGHIKENEDLSRYSGFVIGSSVYWAMSDEFRMFVKRYRTLLSEHPTAVFACCLTIQRETQKNWERVEGYLQSGIGDIPEIDLIDKTAFAGKVEMTKLTLPERAFLWFFFLVTPQKAGDHRDWDKVRSWTDKISAKL